MMSLMSNLNFQDAGWPDRPYPMTEDEYPIYGIVDPDDYPGDLADEGALDEEATP